MSPLRKSPLTERDKSGEVEAHKYLFYWLPTILDPYFRLHKTLSLLLLQSTSEDSQNSKEAMIENPFMFTIVEKRPLHYQFPFLVPTQMIWMLGTWPRFSNAPSSRHAQINSSFSPIADRLTRSRMKAVYRLRSDCTEGKSICHCAAQR